MLFCHNEINLIQFRHIVLAQMVRNYTTGLKNHEVDNCVDHISSSNALWR